jgi:TolA-binding protein
MKFSIVAASVAAIASINLIAAEPSAFGAGNLENPAPYGLTSSEKVVLETKNKLQKVLAKSNNQANEVDSLRERLDGMQSILESLSMKAHNNETDLKNLVTKNAEELKSSDELDKRLNEITQKNSEDIEKIKLMISELSKLIDNINSTYVTKDEYNSLVNDVNKFKDLVASELKKDSKSKKSEKSEFGDLSNAEVAQKAQEYFDKKYYTNAIESYKYLIENHYKPAYANYMIGEMNYRRNNYSEAIAYFKESSSLFDKASYMPNLLLHTAVSMDKTGDKNNAKAFYKGLIASYPKSQEAKDAKKLLKQIK